MTMGLLCAVHFVLIAFFFFFFGQSAVRSPSVVHKPRSTRLFPYRISARDSSYDPRKFLRVISSSPEHIRFAARNRHEVCICLWTFEVVVVTPVVVRSAGVCRAHSAPSGADPARLRVWDRFLTDHPSDALSFLTCTHFTFRRHQPCGDAYAF